MLVIMFPLLSLSYYINLWSEALGAMFSLAIIGAYLGIPVLVLERFRVDLRAFNLYAHRLETVLDYILKPARKDKAKPDIKNIKRELISFIFVALLILIPYACLFLGFFFFAAAGQGKELHFSLSLPPKFIPLVLTQIFVVALPEEFFWRGFVQSALLKKWPNERFFLGLPLGRAVVLTNVLFALAHFVLGFMPERLLTFFPGLIFSALVMREKSLLSAILFHALCNIFAIVMHHSLS